MALQFHSRLATLAAGAALCLAAASAHAEVDVEAARALARQWSNLTTMKLIVGMVLLALLRCLASRHSGPDWRSHAYTRISLSYDVGVTMNWGFQKNCLMLRGGMNDSDDADVSFL